MEKVELGMAFERDTKRTYRFQEEARAGQPPVIGTLYVQKYVLGETPPKRIKVTIEVLED